MRVEKKFLQTMLIDEAVDIVGTPPLNLTAVPAQGAGVNQMIGLRISPKLIQINFDVRTGGISASVRWYVVQWLSDDSIDPFTVVKYFGTVTSGLQLTDYINRAKFRTLKKGVVTTNRETTTTTGLSARTVVVRPRSIVSFNNIVQPERNHIFFIAISSELGLAPVMNLRARMIYTDS